MLANVRGTLESMRNNKDSEFVNFYMSSMFTPSELIGKSATGKKSHNGNSKPTIDINKSALLRGKAIKE
jgi:hypothetical protein